MKSIVTLPLGIILAPALAWAGQSPADMEPLTWMSVPNTQLDSVQADPRLYAELQGNGFQNIIAAWSGGVLDTTRFRLLIWGGGHNDYYGNEMYAFDILSMQWERLTDPTVDWNDCGDPNADGTANARHSYNGMAYIAHADRFFATGGALNCTIGSCGAEPTWTFDFETTQWDNRQPRGSHVTGCENNAAYDPDTQRVYYGSAGGLFAYDYGANAWTMVASDYIESMTSAIDTTRGLLVMVGNNSVYAYDVGAGDFRRQDWSTAGSGDLLTDSPPGFDYDPTTDRFVGWRGGAVYALDPESQQWTAYDVEGGPSHDDGVYGRWRYVPEINAFIAVTATDTDVYFFKFSEGGEIPPPPPGGETGDSGSGDGDSSAGGPDSGGAPDSTGSSGSSNTNGDPGGTSSPATGGGAGGSSGAASDGGGDLGCGCRARPGDYGTRGWWAAAVLLLAGRRRRRASTR